MERVHGEKKREKLKKETSVKARGKLNNRTKNEKAEGGHKAPHRERGGLYRLTPTGTGEMLCASCVFICWEYSGGGEKSPSRTRKTKKKKEKAASSSHKS